MTNSVAPSNVTSIETSVMSSNNDIKEGTIQKIIKPISETTARHLPEDLQQTNEKIQNSKISLQTNKCSYPAIDGNITYEQVRGENIENEFICKPVNDLTREVAPKELPSLYGVECVEILDRIAFNDDDIE